MKTSNIFKALFASALMVSTLAACDSDVFNVNADPFKGSTYTNDVTSPISIYLETQPEFSEYVKALRYSETFNALNQSTDGVSFTAFVPDNDAMEEFYERRGVRQLEDLDPSYVRSFVLYHTVADSITTEDFVTKDSIENLTGDMLLISIDADKAGEAEIGPYLGLKGHISEMGISAYNGKIYVMSKALTPLVETVYDRISESTTSFIMKAAIDASGYADELNTVSDTIVELGQKTVIRRYYTLLDVSDHAFGKAGINSLDELRSALLSRDDRGLSSDELLREYVGYHIINKATRLSEFGNAEGEDVVTSLWGTLAQNQTIMLSIDPKASDIAGKYTFNQAAESASFDEATSNVRATNGYVHELTAWLPVWEPEQTEVLWDLADYSEIRSIVTSSNPEYYQPYEPIGSEPSQGVPVSNASCFTYQVSDAGSANRNYGAITYMPTKKYTLYGTQKGQTSTANFNDRIIFNLGYMGWASMTTPTLVKGKYRVEMSLCYVTGLANVKNQKSGSNGGLMKFIFDEPTEESTVDNSQSVFKTPYTEVSTDYSAGGIFTSTIFDEVEFPETTTHDFKIVVMDPAAGSMSGFSIQIDCIRFIPIK